MDYIKKYENLFDTGKYTAIRYYDHYRNFFRATDFDLDDLIQEAQIKVLEIITKYEKQNLSIAELKKIANKAVGSRLSNILTHCKVHIKTFGEVVPIKECPHCAFPFDESSSSEIQCVNCNNLFNFEESFFTSFPLSLSSNTPSQDSQNKKFNFEELRIILTDKEYIILIYTFVHNLSFTDIAKKIGCTRQRATSIYQRSLEKIKDYFD